MVTILRFGAHWISASTGDEIADGKPRRFRAAGNPTKVNIHGSAVKVIATTVSVLLVFSELRIGGDACRVFLFQR